jgi:hypothetical protein
VDVVLGILAALLILAAFFGGAGLVVAIRRRVDGDWQRVWQDARGLTIAAGGLFLAAVLGAMALGVANPGGHALLYVIGVGVAVFVVLALVTPVRAAREVRAAKRRRASARR